MTTLHQIVDRHAQLSDLYAQPADLDRAAEHRREGDRLYAQSAAQIAAHPQIHRAKRPVAVAMTPEGAEAAWRFRLAAATASDVNPDETLKHALVATQLQAIADGGDATAAEARVRARYVPPPADVPADPVSAPSDA